MTADKGTIEGEVKPVDLSNMTVTAEYGNKEGEEPKFCYHAIRDNEGILIGSVWSGTPFEESERLAKLWAAAPELLKLLQHAVDWIEEQHGETHDTKIYKTLISTHGKQDR